ncbi:MAG: acyl-CoA thioesterase [Pseudomonadota bacterium]
MNLFFRFILFFIRLRFLAVAGFEVPSKIRFRVLPSDSDYFQHHLTNSRFPSFMDLGRLHWLARSGLGQRLPIVVNASQITYLGLIRWGRTFEVETKPVYWDDKYLYLEQRFTSGGKLCAVALTKLVFMGKRGTVPLAEAASAAGVELPAVEPTGPVHDFMQSLSHRH